MKRGYDRFKAVGLKPVDILIDEDDKAILSCFYPFYLSYLLSASTDNNLMRFPLRSKSDKHEAY